MKQMQVRIARELELERRFSAEDIEHMIESGEPEAAAHRVIFYAAPADFAAQLRILRQRLASHFARASDGLKSAYLTFLSELAVGLQSALVSWNLANKPLHGQSILPTAACKAEAMAGLQVVEEWEAAAPQVARALLVQWRQEARARFVAEGSKQPDADADRLMGGSIGDYLRNVVQAIGRSHLHRMAEMRVQGLTATELGNDYAAFLKYTMYLGASFVTTNPVLVDVAWTANPEQWNPVMTQVVTQNPEAEGEELARLATLEVVWANMRLLRPIFLLTNGEMGCVSLQVNPKRHGEAAAMIADAQSIYAALTQRLGGNVPNVVFKLPATLAGLEACHALTKQGVGVNITLNFGLFQLLRFAEAIQEGQAIFSVLSEMNGRLAYPVRDELLGKLPELAAHGIVEADVREAAAWSGVAIVKKLQRLMRQRGYDTSRIRPLVASLRIYKEGAGYDRLPSPYPDITEALGVAIITVFPDVRYAFDRESRMELRGASVDEPVPDAALRTLSHSEIFRQAYYVVDRQWVDREDERFKPRALLALEDVDAVARWEPVRATLGQFGQSYDHFLGRLLSLR